MKNKYLQIIYDMNRISNFHSLYSTNKRDYNTDDNYYENEVHILSEIVENNAITLQEMADIFYKTKSYISQVISGLEAKKLIEKTKSPADARKTIYNVTKKGMMIYYSHLYYDTRQSERLAKALDEYTEDDIKLVHKFLKDFHDFQLADINAITNIKHDEEKIINSN